MTDERKLTAWQWMGYLLVGMALAVAVMAGIFWAVGGFIVWMGG